MQNIIKLRISDLIIKMHSKFARLPFTDGARDWRFKSFLYQGELKPDIIIEVKIVKKIPKIKKNKNIFITKHFADNKENWRLMQTQKEFIFKCDLDQKKQLVFINHNFKKVKVYLLTKKPEDFNSDRFNEKERIELMEFVKSNKGYVWHISDIIYDFLQILLINYLALHNEGIITHAIGIKDIDGRGLLFIGQSGAGKSTTARIWDKYSKAMILNDDRIIIRKRNNKFFIYGSPWHGDFDDYLASRIESGELRKLFFIHHAAKNTLKLLSQKEAFILLYPNLFPAFWNKKCLDNTITYSEDLLNNVICFSLGFKNNRKIIDFVRK